MLTEESSAAREPHHENFVFAVGEMGQGRLDS